jgi:hypothetical protein
MNQVCGAVFIGRVGDVSTTRAHQKPFVTPHESAKKGHVGGHVDDGFSLGRSMNERSKLYAGRGRSQA